MRDIGHGLHLLQHFICSSRQVTQYFPTQFSRLQNCSCLLLELKLAQRLVTNMANFDDNARSQMYLILYINSLSPSVRLSVFYLSLTSFDSWPLFLWYPLSSSFSQFFFLSICSFFFSDVISLSPNCFSNNVNRMNFVGPRKYWFVIGRTQLFSQWRKPHTHTRAPTHVTKQWPAVWTRDFFGPLHDWSTVAFGPLDNPKRMWLLDQFDHRCARCRARPTLKDVANWNYKTGLFFTIRRKDILNH